VKAAVLTLLHPVEDNELAEQAPSLKSIMSLYPKQEGLLVRSNIRHIMPPYQS
jgi:hypothetical protein